MLLLSFLFFFMMPSSAVIYYYATIASDRYAAGASFVVRGLEGGVRRILSARSPVSRRQDRRPATAM
jgi:capsule polysaccharide export protein KpsE/RkpR